MADPANEEEPAAPRPLPTAPGLPTGAQGIAAAIAAIQYYLPAHAFLFFSGIQQTIYPRRVAGKTCSAAQYNQLVAAFVVCLVAGIIDKVQKRNRLCKCLLCCISHTLAINFVYQPGVSRT